MPATAERESMMEMMVAVWSVTLITRPTSPWSLSTGASLRTPSVSPLSTVKVANQPPGSFAVTDAAMYCTSGVTSVTPSSPRRRSFSFCSSLICETVASSCRLRSVSIAISSLSSAMVLFFSALARTEA